MRFSRTSTSGASSSTVRRPTRWCDPIDHVGVQKLKNGLNAVGVAPIAGRVSGTILTKVADLAEAVGQRPHPVHAVPEADRPGCARRQARRAARRPRRARAAVAAVALAPQPHGVHGHRVLQAVLRRDPQAVPGAGARAGEAAGGHQRPARRADHDQHQRLPELVRPHPGRRHRVQGPDGRRRRRARKRVSRCTWAAAWAWTAVSAANCASTRCCPPSWATTSTRVVRNFVKQREQGERFATWAVRADEADLR